MTTTVAFTAFRRRLAELFDQTVSTNEPLIITRANGGAAVLISADQFDSWRETLHLVSTAENTRSLAQAIDEANAGRFVDVDID